ncbi:MAG TPA: iron ABC transporter permease [Holophagaceae bacterium]|nr:iron ABC transporter permease [Holophagaceae bacterium]
MRIRASLPVLLLALAGMLAAALLAALVFGELRLGPAQILAGLRGRDELAHAVLWNIRLPRALVGASVGAALAASGVVMQALFRNPLASPGLLGVSSGGALGAVLAIALGWSAASLWSVPLCALAGAFLATGAVLMLARQGAGMERLLLSGIALNALLGAATSFVLTVTAGRFEKSGAMVFWLMGGLEDRTWEHVGMCLPGIALGCLLLLPLGRAMNLLALGEQGAQSLGVHVRRLRAELVVLSTVLAALATAVAGVVGFVGLVVPHMLRLVLGPDHRRLLPLSMLGGAVFTLACDLAVRTLPGGLRLGVVSSLVGGPFFLWLLRRPR